MAVLLAIMLGALFGGAAVVGARNTAARRKDGRAILAPLAARRGIELDDEERLVYATPEGEHVRVRITREKGFVWVVCDVRLVPPALPLFGVLRGHCAGLDQPLADRIWKHALAEGEAVRNYESVLCDGTRIEVKRGMHPSQPVDLTTEEANEAIDFALRIARFDVYGLRELEAVPEAQVHRSPDGLVRVEVPGPSPIFVGPVLGNNHARTSAWTSIATAVDADVAARVAEIGGTLETTGNEVRIWWPTIEVDRDRLLGAIEILRKVATGTSVGAFR